MTVGEAHRQPNTGAPVTMAGFDEAGIRAAVAAAIQAPSRLNSQPWRFRFHNGALDVLADPHRSSATGSRIEWASRIACGAATFNARIALARNGTPADVLLTPDLTDTALMARLSPGRPRPATLAEQKLFDAIGRRHSNRHSFSPTAVPADLRNSLVDAAGSEGACWTFSSE
jgi:nitroreductase